VRYQKFLRTHTRCAQVARRCGYVAACGSGQDGWDLLNHALPIAFNSRTNLMFTCVCSPEAHSSTAA
jgi:hypothetical protein